MAGEGMSVCYNTVCRGRDVIGRWLWPERTQVELSGNM